MTVHHPSRDLLSEYAAGTMEPGAGLVVACHVDRCADCRRETSLWENLGGALLEETTPVALGDRALERALERIAGEQPRSPVRPPLPPYLARYDVPASLRRQHIGSRRWLAPGIWFAPLDMGGKARARTYLVRADKNRKLPRHSHANRELTVVLSGGYRDDLGEFDAGDFIETDERVHHAPWVTQESECLCLISSDGPMRLEGIRARAIQAFAGWSY